ncbi:MAG: AAA family ATPase [Corynebacterium variabile]
MLVGRDDVLSNYFDAIEGEPGDLERLTLLQGPQGIGKAALLTTIDDRLRRSETYGPWRVFDETATPGFVGRLTRAMAEDLEEIGDEQVKKLSELSWLLKPVTVKRSSTEMVDWTKTFRDSFTALCDSQDLLNRQFNGDMNAGILVTLDEIHRNNAEEVRQFAAAVQHLVREGRNISVVIAGIPQSPARSCQERPRKERTIR